MPEPKEERIAHDRRLAAVLKEHAYDTPVVQVGKDDLRRLLAERDAAEMEARMAKAEMSVMVDAQLSRRVRAFHLKFGHPVADTPCIPDDETARFRLKLVAEEFFELLEAAIPNVRGSLTGIARARTELGEVIEVDPVKVDLPELIDACEDLKYVIEGTHVVCGVQSGPIGAEVHRANMAKDAVYVEAKDGFKKGERIKPMKPEDWAPPDIAGKLREQGWEG